MREAETPGGSSAISGCQGFRIPKSEQEVAAGSHSLMVGLFCVKELSCPVNTELPREAGANMPSSACGRHETTDSCSILQGRILAPQTGRPVRPWESLHHHDGHRPHPGVGKGPKARMEPALSLNWYNYALCLTKRLKTV